MSVFNTSDKPAGLDTGHQSDTQSTTLGRRVDSGRRTFLGTSLAIGATALVGASASLQAQIAVTPIDPKGKYELIEPAQPTADPTKVEVLDAFSYACPHCARFYPHLKGYEEKLPEHAAVVRLPIIFNKTWADYARVYYTAESTRQAAWILGSIDFLGNPIGLFKDVTKERRGAGYFSLHHDHDITAAREELGWEPRPYREGVLEITSTDWWKDESAGRGETENLGI